MELPLKHLKHYHLNQFSVAAVCFMSLVLSARMIAVRTICVKTLDPGNIMHALYNTYCQEALAGRLLP